MRDDFYWSNMATDSATARKPIVVLRRVIRRMKSSVWRPRSRLVILVIVVEVATFNNDCYMNGSEMRLGLQEALLLVKFYIATGRGRVPLLCCQQPLYEAGQ